MANKKPHIAVILAGGTGSRIAHLFSDGLPKQFQRITDPSHSMLQLTLKRVAMLAPERIVVVTQARHAAITHAQLKEISLSADILAEPEGRNTAPAICLAALSSQEEALISFFPADHAIENEQAWQRVVQQGLQYNAPLTFGITPTHASDQFGYIEQGAVRSHGIYHVNRFTEKPDRATAARWFKTDRYLWNSGMFLFPRETLLAAYRQFAPDILSGCIKHRETGSDSAYSACPSVSIDYALIEHMESLAVLPLRCGWHDLGTEEAIQAYQGEGAKAHPPLC